MKIGILGGGQLGRMFLQEAISYPVQTKILDPQKNAPCANICDEFICGDFHNDDEVAAFGIDCDVIGIEIEHIGIEGFKRLEQMGKKTIPCARTLEIIQDKGLQKQFYLDNDIATMPFVVVDKPRELKELPFTVPFVQKTRKGGYDGKGVQVIDKSADQLWDVASVFEKACDIKKEIALVVCVDVFHNISVYPIIEMEFDNQLNLVDVVKMPAILDAEVETKAINIAKKVCQAFNDAGIFAIEMFVDNENNVFVNETACRVHNSGHLTIEACQTSQFGQMLRILSGLKLASVDLKYPAAMLNLVGCENGQADVSFLKDICNIPKTFLHWYGKSEVRIGRKMGHITVIAQDIDELNNTISLLKSFDLKIKAKK